MAAASSNPPPAVNRGSAAGYPAYANQYVAPNQGNNGPVTNVVLNSLSPVERNSQAVNGLVQVIATLEQQNIGLRHELNVLSRTVQNITHTHECLWDCICCKIGCCPWSDGHEPDAR